VIGQAEREKESAMTTTAALQAQDRADERTRPPFLRRVRIRGYKSISFCDVALQPLTILVGRNAAGKSNFLDALAFLRDAMETSLTEAVGRRGGWSSVVSRAGDTRRIAFEVEVGFEGGWPFGCDRERFTGVPVSPHAPTPDEEGVPYVATYGFAMEAQAHDVAVLVQEFLRFHDPVSEAELGFQVNRGTFSPNWKGLSETTGRFGWPPQFKSSPYRPDRLLLAVMGDQPFLDLANAIRFTGFYNFNPEAMRPPRKPLLGTLLERDGRNLASAITSLKEIDPASLERVRDYLTLVAEEVVGFEVKTYDEYVGLRFRLRSGSPSVPFEFDAASMSDGTLRALAALIAAFQIHLPSGPTVIGIEEPETALHPAAMRVLVDALDEATQRTQILLTTHSADLLSGRDLTPGQILVARNRAGQTHLTPVDPASRQIIAKELYSLAELQRMDRLDLDEADLKRQAQIGDGIEGA
jgi:predicted ATPase